MTDPAAGSEPITGISSMAMQRVLAELVRDYGIRSGCSVVIEAVGGVDASRRVGAGEAFDFVVLAAEAIDRLAAGGRVVAGSRTDLARSDIAIAVVAGAARPGIDGESAVRDAVLRARAVGYSTGPSGDHMLRLLERWGAIGGAAPRLVQAAPGLPVSTLLARGDVDLGFQQLSELIDVPGVDVVGPLPSPIQQSTVFSAALCTDARQSHRRPGTARVPRIAPSRCGQAPVRHGARMRPQRRIQRRRALSPAVS
jgi:molybdate transport system substrate-binding protein